MSARSDTSTRSIPPNLREKSTEILTSSWLFHVCFVDIATLFDLIDRLPANGVHGIIYLNYIARYCDTMIVMSRLCAKCYSEREARCTVRLTEYTTKCPLIAR